MNWFKKSGKKSIMNA